MRIVKVMVRTLFDYPFACTEVMNIGSPCILSVIWSQSW